MDRRGKWISSDFIVGQGYLNMKDTINAAHPG
jgi:hypothetical protein